LLGVAVLHCIQTTRLNAQYSISLAPLYAVDLPSVVQFQSVKVKISKGNKGVTKTTDLQNI
jgi:hypothetical protein